MKITYSVNTKVLTNSGKPSFSFSCEHCLQSFLDLGSCLYSERENGAPDPAINALKDNIDPYGKDTRQAIKKLVSAVKKHNANLSSDS